MFAAEAGSGVPWASGLAAVGFSQLRASSCTATSTPASSHQANALRVSAMPTDSTSPPTPSLLRAIDATVKEWAGQTSRMVLAVRREEHEPARIHGLRCGDR